MRLTGAGAFLDLPMNELQEDFEFGQHGDAQYWIVSPFQSTTGSASYTLRLAYDETPIVNDIDKQIGTAAHRIATGNIYDRFHLSSSATELTELSADLEHMRAELVTRGQLLQEQEQHLRTLLDHIGEGVVTFDITGLIETYLS